LYCQVWVSFFFSSASCTVTPGISTALLRSRWASSAIGTWLDSKYFASGHTRTVVPCLRSPETALRTCSFSMTSAAGERDGGHLAVAVAGGFQPRGQRVGHRHAHAVQAAGEAVGAAPALVELAAGMQAREHQLDHRAFSSGCRPKGMRGRRPPR
jgi:hypothetical protein